MNHESQPRQVCGNCQHWEKASVSDQREHAARTKLAQNGLLDILRTEERSQETKHQLEIFLASSVRTDYKTVGHHIIGANACGDSCSFVVAATPCIYPQRYASVEHPQY